MSISSKVFVLFIHSIGDSFNLAYLRESHGDYRGMEWVWSLAQSHAQLEKGEPTSEPQAGCSAHPSLGNSTEDQDCILQ